jgi:hypothetical protein
VAGKRQDLVDLVALSEKLAQNLERSNKASMGIHNSLFGAGQAAGSIVGGGSNPGGGGNGILSGPNNRGASSVGSTIGFAAGMLGKVAGATVLAAVNNLPSPQQAAAYQLATANQSFFGNTGFSQITALQKALSAGGTAISSQDAVNAIASLQSNRIYNVGSIASGVGALSNYAPNLGIAGTAQAAASFNQASSVNLMNQIGVQVRGANGLMRDPNQIANDFVDKIWQETPPLQGSASQAYAYLIGALQPGNQLYFILNTYVQDPNTQQIIINKLFAKAKGLPGTATKQQLQSAGLLTATTNQMSTYNTAQLGLTQATQQSINEGTVSALKMLTTATNDFAGAAKNLGGLLKAYGYGSTAMGAAGTGASSLLGGLAGNLLGTAGASVASKLFSKAGSFIKGFFKGGILSDAEKVALFLGGEALDPAGGGAIADAALTEGISSGTMSTVLGILKGRASGGPVGSKTPYIVGEKGPEFFIPKSDGMIISNKISNQLGLFRADSGGVSAGGATPYSGSKLTQDQLSAVLQAAGFSGNALSTAQKVVGIESGGLPTNLNPNASTGDYSMGLFQINMLGQMGVQRNAEYLKKYGSIGYTGPSSLYNPAINAKIAYDMSGGGTDWSPWSNTMRKLGMSTGGGVASSGGGTTINTVNGIYNPGLLQNGFGTGAPGTVLASMSGSMPAFTINITVPPSTDPHQIAKITSAAQTGVTAGLKKTGVVKS